MVHERTSASVTGHMMGWIRLQLVGPIEASHPNVALLRVATSMYCSGTFGPATQPPMTTPFSELQFQAT